MARSPIPRLVPPIVLAVAALSVGVLQLQVFPQTSETSIAVFTEGAAVLVLLAGLFWVAVLDPPPEVTRLLYAGSFVLLLHAVTETADELVHPPLAFTVIVEHVGLIVGLGLLLGAAGRWRGHQTRQAGELRAVRSFLERTEELAEVGGWKLDVATDELEWTDGTRRIHDLPRTYEPTLEEALSFYHADDRDRIAELVENCRENGVPYEAELRIVTAEDRLRWVGVTGEAVTDDGTVVAIRGAIRDITGEKERQQKLSVLARVLRHNLRNDLNVVMGRTEDILSELRSLDAPTDGPEGQQDGGDAERVEERAVDRIERHARSVLEASEELLALGETVRRYNELTETKATLEPTRLEPLLEEVRTEKQSAHETATVRVQCPSELTVLCMPAYLRAALDEVVENGIVHADTGEPTVEISGSRSEGGRVRISVRDRGPGIPAHELATLQGGRESALHHGSGLGLWFADWLLSQQHGTISVSEAEERGTVVTMSLPATPESVEDRPERGERATARHPEHHIGGGGETPVPSPER